MERALLGMAAQEREGIAAHASRGGNEGKEKGEGETNLPIFINNDKRSY